MLTKLLKLFRKKEQEEKQPIEAVLLGYTLLMDRLKDNPVYLVDNDLLISTFLSCSLNKYISIAAALAMTISLSAQREAIDILSKSLADIIDYSEPRNAEVCSFASAKAIEIHKVEENLLAKAENKMIKTLQELMK